MSDSLLSLLFPIHGIQKLTNLNDQEFFENLNKTNLTQIKKSMLFFGDNSICKTSLLFQACLSVALSKREAVYICKEQFSNLPLFVHNMPKPESDDVLKLIKFKYYKTSEELIEYLSSIHLEKNLPAILIIEDLLDFIELNRFEQELDCMRQILLLTAHIKSVVDFINSKFNCVCIVASRNIERDFHLKLNFDSFCYMKKADNNNSNNTNNEDEYELAYTSLDEVKIINLNFKIKNSNIFLININCEQKSFKI